VVVRILAAAWIHGFGIVFNVNLIILTSMKKFLPVQAAEDVFWDAQLKLI
jgi:hypothetical protein